MLRVNFVNFKKIVCNTFLVIQQYLLLIFIFKAEKHTKASFNFF